MSSDTKPVLKPGIKPRLRNYAEIANAISALFRPYIEVVLHDLETEQVVHIANNFSKRELGEPSLLHEIDFNPNDRVIGPYEKINWDGKRLKSISVVIRDDDDKPTGIMCLNADVSHFHIAKQAFDALIAVPDNGEKPDVLFKEDWHERINEFVNAWVIENGVIVQQMTSAQRKKLVFALEDSGAFNGKNSTAYASRVLGLSRATIYNYLKQKKQAKG